MALPPDVEEKLLACEKDLLRMRLARLEISDSVDDLIAQDSDAIPEETFDDPSVMREVDQLSRMERRVRRSSASPEEPTRLALGSSPKR